MTHSYYSHLDTHAGMQVPRAGFTVSAVKTAVERCQHKQSDAPPCPSGVTKCTARPDDSETGMGLYTRCAG